MNNAPQQDSYQTLLQNIVEGVPMRVFWKNRDSRYLGCNTLFAKDAGFTHPEELIGKTDFEMGWKEQAGLYRSDDLRVMESGMPKLCYEEPQTTPKGEAIWLRTSKVPLRDAAQKVVGILGFYEDITAQKQTEAAKQAAEAMLAGSEQRFRSLIEDASDLALLLDIHGVILFASPSVKQLFGYEISEVQGKIFLEFIHPDDASATLADLSGIVQNHKVLIRTEKRFRHKNGVWLTLETISRNALDDPKLGGIIVNARDITERKKTEEALRENQMRLDLALRSAGMGVWHWDLIRNRRHFDAQTCHLLGIDFAAFTGAEDEFFRAIHPDDHEAIRASLARTIEQNVPYEMDFRAVWPDGGIHYQSVRGALIRDDKGRPVRIDGVIWDITARKQSELVLMDSERRFRDLIDGASDIFVVIDLHGLITYLSPTVTRTLGYEFTEMVGTRIDQYLHPEDLLIAYADIAKIVQTPEIRPRAELRYRHKNGSWVVIETLGKNAISNPLINGIIFNGHDITDRKRSEQTISKVNRALKALSQGNAILVHATDENQLFRDMCHAIVSTGGYLLAWIGLAEHDAGKTVRPVAYAGFKPGYMEQANITWADVELGQGPVGKAIRNGTPQIIQNAHLDPSFNPWRHNADTIGYSAVVSLPLSSSGIMLGALSIYSAEINAFDKEEIKLLMDLADDLAYGIETLRTRAERDRISSEYNHHQEILRQSLEDSIKAIADTVEARDPYTAGHQSRVAKLAAAIAREVELPEEKIHGIGLAAGIHDLGKISIPAEILSKPGKLTDIELMLVKNHARAGYDILKNIKFPWPIATMVWQHHERMDGSGYPQGLKGEEILLESRILAVADVVEAMASHRPYRAALGVEAALNEIERGRGSIYDAAVVDACLKLFREGRFLL